MYTKKIIKECVNYLNDENREVRWKCKSCSGSVEECHEEIHFKKTTKEYECTDSMANYIAKYFPRYVTEIRNILDIIDFSWDKEVKILSIGNGPSSDLYAFLDKKECENSKIKYVGIDMNEKWDYINKITKKRVLNRDSNCEVDFKKGDVFEEINDFEDIKIPNFLIFQYVISAMANDPNATEEDIKGFIDKIIDKIVIKMPENSYIIFNDINHNTKARDYFEYFFNNLKGIIKGKYWKLHYARGVYKYGVCYNSDKIYAEYENQYDERKYCNSAQLIIKKESNQ